MLQTFLISFLLLMLGMKSSSNNRGGSSATVKVPGDVPRKGILFRTSMLAKGDLFGNFSRCQSGQMLFGNFGQRNVKLR